MNARIGIDPREDGPIGPGWRLLVPAVFAAVSVVLAAGPMFTPVPFVPMLPMLVVGVWALYQPQLMPPWFALIIGLVTDFTLALPAGVHATLMPALAFFLDHGNRKQQTRPFLLDWLLAGFVVALYQLLATELAALGGARRPFSTLLPQLLVTWALFPAVTRISAWTYGRMTRAR